MSNVSSPAPSGVDGEQSRLGEGTSSGKLDMLVKKLQDTKESTPEPSSAAEEKTDRKSRRKPKVTRKVVESEEEDAVIGGIGFEGIDELLNSMADEDESYAAELAKHSDKFPKSESPGPPKQKEEDSVDIDEDGNYILPEGTVVVHPEEVTEDQNSHFQGPEFKTTGGRRQVITGDIDNEIIHCSACNKQINTNSSASLKRHPVLKVLICKKCYKWYTSAEIEQDADGVDEQCRWCGEGGDLLLCDRCNNAFCRGCIRRNLGRKELSEIANAGDDAKWLCYVCDPKPLASLIHNCTQIIKAVEEKEKENALRLEKLKKEKEKERAKQKTSSPGAASSSGSSGARQTAMKSTTKPPRTQQKQALQTSNVNIAKPKGVVAPQPVQLALTQGGVTYLLPQQVGNVNLAPQPGVTCLYQKDKAGKLVPVTGKVPQMNFQPVQQARFVQGSPGQPTQQQAVHTIIAEHWDINESNVDNILERILAATQSMNMLLYTLREDMKKKTKKVTPAENLKVRKEISHKLRRAMQAYKKSFLDISLYSRKPRPKPQPKPTAVPQPKKGVTQAARKSARVEIIELSDEEDDDDDSTSQTSASTTKSSLSASKPPSSSSKSPKDSISVKGKAQGPASNTTKAKSAPLKVALFKNGAPPKGGATPYGKASDDPKAGKSADSSNANSNSNSDGDDMDFEVTEIDLDAEENSIRVQNHGDTDSKMDDGTSDDGAGGDGTSSTKKDEGLDAGKSKSDGASGTEGKNDSPRPASRGARKSSDELFGTSKSDKTSKRPASEAEDDESDKQGAQAKRCREDIEAQRQLHKDLMDDSSSEGDKSGCTSRKGTTGSSEMSATDSRSDKEKDDDYKPEGKGSRSRTDRRSKQASKTSSKFKEFREARRRREAQRKNDVDSSEESDTESSGASKKRSKPGPKSSKQMSTNSVTSKSSHAKKDTSATPKSESKKSKSSNSSSGEKHPSVGNGSVEKPVLKELSIRIQRVDSKGTFRVKSKKQDTSKNSANGSRETEESSDESLDRDLERLLKVPRIKKKKPSAKNDKEDDEGEDMTSPKRSVEERRKMAREKIDDMTSKGKLSRKSTKTNRKNNIEDLSSGEEPSDIDEELDDIATNSHDESSPLKRAKDAESSDENERARKALLDDESSDNSDDSDFERTKHTRKGAGRRKADKSSGSEDSFELDDDVETKKKTKSTALLQSKVSDSDSDFDLRPKKRKKKKTSSDNDSSDTDSYSEEDKKKSKKGKGKGKGKKKSSDSDDDFTSGSEKKKGKGKGKGKRKRRAKMATDSSEAGEGAEGSEDGDTPGKKRKKIRKVIKDKNLKQETKDAAMAERERRKRIDERQKLFNEITETDLNSPTKCPMTTKLVLDVDEETKETLIEVHPKLIKKLKPHQVEAVKFLWNCCCESVDRVTSEEGAGCILAHCMGLGKTLSTISFVHTLLFNEETTKLRTALIVCPLNTVLNWVNEWTMWFDKSEQLDIYELSAVKDNWTRSSMLREWKEGGGICIMGYEMYRNLKNHRNVKSKKQKTIFTESLVDPGPDVVVCDEGHILKNSDSAISKAMSQIRTKRRVVLTGTPLQNNLMEYHCMVDFVKPNLLGSKKEFSNRFANPITNGQSSDATQRDFKLMKKRAHVLHESLAGCVQRKDYSALTKYLMPKHEYVIAVRITPVQIKLYEEYLRRNFGGEATVRNGRLFTDYQALMRIWTHPWILKLDEIRQENKRTYDDESDFLDDASITSEGSFSGDSRSSKSDDDVVVLSDEDDQWKPKPRTSRRARGQTNKDGEDKGEVVNSWKTRSRGGGGESGNVSEEETDKKVSSEWWAEFVSEESKRDMTLSGKIMLLAQVLKMCESIGDKVLVFSQALLSLDLIEDFLEHWDSCQNAEDEKNKDGAMQSWTKGADYFRMDGSTSPALRQTWCDSFNDPENTRARLFLISTRAGSLGINLVAANRVIVFDASWNPTHDVQSIFRVYRFGQQKPVYVYRFLAQGTMEEKIYERQVTKQSLSQRVVDEHQLDRHFTSQDLRELYNFRPDRLDDPDREDKPTPKLPKDRLLAELLTEYPDLIVNYHEHDSLLENRPEQDLTEEERKAAWEEYEMEKKGLLRQTPQYNYGAHAGYRADAYGGMGGQLGRPSMSNYGGYPMMNPNLASMIPDMQQIAQVIFQSNPNMSQDELQVRVQQYIAMRLQTVQTDIARQAQLRQEQLEKQMSDEQAKLRRLQMATQRQEERMNSMQRDDLAPVSMIQAMMGGLPGTSRESSTSRHDRQEKK